MTSEQAEALGYRVVVASASEVGLAKDGHGLRTWWRSQFTEWPTLEHPEIQRAIEIDNEPSVPLNTND